MSTECFIASLERREAALIEKIAEIVKRDRGERILAHFRKEQFELDKIREALHKARRTGVGVT